MSFTIHFPISIGQDWNVEEVLSREIQELRNCKLDRILFLDADLSSLKQRKDNDNLRNRGFFDHYISKMHEHKRKWFMNHPNVTVINVNDKTPEVLAEMISHWFEEQWKYKD